MRQPVQHTVAASQHTFLAITQLALIHVIQTHSDNLFYQAEILNVNVWAVWSINSALDYGQGIICRILASLKTLIIPICYSINVFHNHIDYCFHTSTKLEELNVLHVVNN